MSLGGTMLWTLDFDDYSGQFCNQGQFPVAHAIKQVFDEYFPTTTTTVTSTTTNATKSTTRNTTVIIINTTKSDKNNITTTASKKYLTSLVPEPQKDLAYATLDNSNNNNNNSANQISIKITKFMLLSFILLFF